MYEAAVLTGDMIRKVVVGIIGVVMAITLSGCGAVQAVASSIIAPCEPTYFSAVLWSPDGKHIAFEAARLNDPHLIYVMNSDGTDVRQLSDFTSWTGFRWLSDSQTVVFSDYEVIYEVTLDGTVSNIPIVPKNSYGAPNFASSPDGKTMFIQPETIGTGPILLVDQDTGGTIKLTEGNEYLGEWSPDGTHIAYLSESGAFVSTMKADGSEQRKVAEGSAPVHWSPDGQWISFADFSGGSSIYTIRPDGTDEKRITEYVSFIPYGWLPDSQHIAYVSDFPNALLKVIDINTLAIETITTIPAFNWSWSPDGSQLVFVGLDNSSSVADVQELYIANRDGSGLKRLTDNPGRYQCLRWPF